MLKGLAHVLVDDALVNAARCQVRGVRMAKDMETANHTPFRTAQRLRKLNPSLIASEALA